MSENWSPSSWRSKKIAQDVHYDNPEDLDKVMAKLRTLPPLVTPSEIERLRTQLTLVQNRKGFLLHAGDCAESFEACTQENIANKIGLILSFSLILVWGARLPVIRIGRIAGQYAKPRSSATEIVNGKEIPSFRGDNVNGISTEERKPDPERLLSAYFHSTTTLNYIRSLLTSGFASLNHPRDWSLAHVRSPALRQEFEKISEGLADALEFCYTVGAEGFGRGYAEGGRRGVLGEVDFYTSHEGLMLNYEESLTRLLPLPPSLSPNNPNTSPHLGQSSIPSDPNSPTTKAPPSPSDQQSSAKGYYNTSAHFLWIGDRTRQIDGAHVEYFRGIRNPIGIKVGPTMDGKELLRLLDIVNPDRENGKVTLITRYGASKVEASLPTHITAVQASDHPVIWICDPMHGNTHTSSSGLKTRHFSAIMNELTSSLRIHSERNSRLGGVSLEFTGELTKEGFSVTECLGGSMELEEGQLGLRYQSFCDPRLNFEQSLDLAFLISNHFKNERRGGLHGRSPTGEQDVFLAELGRKG